MMSGENKFTNNYAANSGGAIKWDDLEPGIVSDSVTYINNSAKLYGNDIASFPQKLIALTKDDYKKQILKVANNSNKKLNRLL
jgi:hypothetical protein